jgi:hypothetical protein
MEMAGSTFQTNPFDLHKLLEDCHRGVLQLPDFQRSWVWDEDRIKSLIASVSRAFPVGALMSLEAGGPVNFKPRPVEGAPPEAKQAAPQSLLLDGQQRMTSLYQVTLRGKVVETVTPKHKKVKRWFYIDIRRAMDLSIDREEAIVGVPEDRIVRTDFGRETILDLSTPDREYACLMYPVSQVFDWDKWQDGFDKHWRGDQFGELYGSAVESRIARDFMEVPAWLKGGPEPSTVSETIFRADRLKTMRMRLSAAYKGVNALLMKEGAQDFRSGQKFDHTVFFGENVDIHHVFPQDWCKKHGIKPAVFDSIINKTPLTYRTNRLIGGVAPSEYIAKLEAGTTTTPPIDPVRLDGYLISHLIDPAFLRADSFDAFMADRQKKLLALIERATGKAAYRGELAEEGEDVEGDEDTLEATLTIAGT